MLNAFCINLTSGSTFKDEKSGNRTENLIIEDRSLMTWRVTDLITISLHHCSTIQFILTALGVQSNTLHVYLECKLLCQHWNISCTRSGLGEVYVTNDIRDSWQTLPWSLSLCLITLAVLTKDLVQTGPISDLKLEIFHQVVQLYLSQPSQELN